MLLPWMPQPPWRSTQNQLAAVSLLLLEAVLPTVGEEAPSTLTVQALLLAAVGKVLGLLILLLILPPSTELPHPHDLLLRQCHWPSPWVAVALQWFVVVPQSLVLSRSLEAAAVAGEPRRRMQLLPPAQPAREFPSICQCCCCCCCRRCLCWSLWAAYEGMVNVLGAVLPAAGWRSCKTAHEWKLVGHHDKLPTSAKLVPLHATWLPNSSPYTSSLTVDSDP